MMDLCILAPLCLEGNISANWLKYMKKFEIFLKAYHNEKTSESKIALLLHSGGEDLLDIFESFGLNDKEKANLDIVLKKFDDFFIPATNVTFERYVFFTRKQLESESFEQYMASLKNLSKSCDFGSLNESLVRDIFVVGLSDKVLQERLLNIPDLTLSKALEMCRSKSVVTQQLLQMQLPDGGNT